MNTILAEVLPIFMMFGVGSLLRHLKVLHPSHGQIFIKIIFNLALPALIIHSFSKVTLQPEFFFLPGLAALMHLSAFVVASITGKIYRLPPSKLGVYLIGSMIMNIGFVIPFIVAGYGNEGMARLALIDFGNAIMTFSLAYYLACKHGTKGSGGLMLNKFIKAAPVWGIVIGITLNITGIRLPLFILNFAEQAGNLTIPLLLLSLGLFFNPRFENMRYIISIIFIRALTGLGVAIAGIYAFNINGIMREILLIASLAPVGFNTITFAAMEKLDERFAATLVSFGIIVGIILMPLLLLVFKI